jgi:glycosyltransferase involved in cell wall biosynthesis
MVFAEAMSMGVPVIGPEIAPVTEVILAGCGVLVRPEDPRALAAALYDLARSPAKRRSYAAAGKAHALATWTGGRAAAKVVDAYHQLLFGESGQALK